LRHFKTNFLLLSVVTLFTSSVFAQESSNSDTDLDQPALPVLSDTTNFEKLRTHLINYHALLREDLEKAETIAPMMQELCPVYFEMKSVEENKETRQFWDEFDDLERNNSTNYRFLEKVTEMYKNDELAYKKPFGAVIQGVIAGTNIFEPKSSSNPEQKLWNEAHDSEDRNELSTKEGKAITTYPKSVRGDSVFVFTKTGKYRMEVNTFSKHIGDCSSFFSYRLEPAAKQSEEEPVLISSPFDLDLEFVQNEELDQRMSEKFQPVCADCPVSGRYQQSFARLKGYENFYFTYTREPGKLLDETSVPQRSLVYYNGNLLRIVYTIQFDKFGCGCI
jgi:hypothetical protein|tara:strand:- start:1513 stop:2514 length:1002 start_codon:yes stop_codon:yes gene_type:complete